MPNCLNATASSSPIGPAPMMATLPTTQLYPARLRRGSCCCGGRSSVQTPPLKRCINFAKDIVSGPVDSGSVDQGLRDSTDRLIPESTNLLIMPRVDIHSLPATSRTWLFGISPALNET